VVELSSLHIAFLAAHTFPLFKIASLEYRDTTSYTPYCSAEIGYSGHRYPFPSLLLFFVVDLDQRWVLAVLLDRLTMIITYLEPCVSVMCSTSTPNQ
jgi:hypothetical protein